MYIFKFLNGLISILFIFNISMAQEPCDGHCLPDDVVQTLRQSIIDLENADSLNTKIIFELEESIKLYKQYQLNDSLTIDLYDQKINLLNNRIDLYKELSKEVQPKWYENRWLWFFGGIIITTQSIKLAGELSD
tara:strand:+ start:50 stop:451 length:402 start_codon:yes stop_codon:yes gene_type:complete